jgi:hypothetical protein
MSNISDHFATFASLSGQSNINGNSKVQITRRMTGDRCRLALAGSIREFDWNSLASVECPDACYNKFSDVLFRMYDNNFPLKTYNVKPLDVEKSYITPDIKLLLRQKHKLQKTI